MKASTLLTALTPLLSLPSLTLANPLAEAAKSPSFSQVQNPFLIPAKGFSFVAGEPTKVRWYPTTKGTITLVLRSGGGDGSFVGGLAVAEKIPNSGAYTWTPPTDITRGNDYTLQLINDAYPDQTSFTPFFVIDSENLVASVTSAYAYGAPTAADEQLLPTSTVKGTGIAVAEATATAFVGGDD